MTAPADDVKSLFGKALELTNSDDRAAYLDKACGSNAALRCEIEGLLQALQNAGNFMNSPAPPEGTVALPPLAERPGTVIGPYKLLQQLGEGGMGVVYMAEQQEPVRRKVALKIIKPGMDSAQVISRFEAERQALAMMDHVNIAKVLEAGTTDTGRPYFVMELVHGVSITKYCDDNKLTPRQRLELFIPVCQAVQHAHQKGIIHRDIKPSNVLVTMYDDKPVPKIIDFGVAKAIEHQLTEKTLFTQYGALVGTFEYMSPEQAELNAFGVDTRSDIYSLGVLLYELLTGTTPLERQRLRDTAFGEIVRLIKEEEAVRPSLRLSSFGAALAGISRERGTEPTRLAKLLRGDLDWIVMRCLEKDRARRYDTATGLAQDIRNYLAEEPVLACPPSAGYRFRKMARRHKVALTTAALVVTTLLLGTAVSAWQAVRAARAETDALANADRAQKGELLARHSEKKANESYSLALANAARAKEQEQIAKKQAEIADKERRRAQASEAKAEWGAYPYHVARAQRELATGNFPLFYHYLKQCRPDFRGWEHDYLYTLANAHHQTLFETNQEVYGVAFSPDNKLLACAAGEKVELWDLDEGRQVRFFKLFTGRAIDVVLAFSPDAKSLATATFPTNYAPMIPGSFGEVKLWDTGSGKEIRTFKGNPGPVTGLTFSPDGKLLLGGGFGGSSKDLRDTVKLWDAGTGQEVLSFDGEPNGTSPRKRISVAFSPDGRRFVSASFDGTVKLWELASGKEILTLQAPNQAPKKRGKSALVAFSPDSKRLISSSFDETIKLWDLANGQAIHTFKGNSGSVQCLALSPDGKRLAIGSNDEMVIGLWDTAKGQKIHTLKGHSGSVQSLAFSPDGKRIASVGKEFLNGEKCEVMLWDAASFPVLPQTLKGHTDSVQSVAFSPDGKWLASGAGAASPFASFGGPRGEKKENLILWDAATGQEFLTFKINGPEGQVQTVAFSPDGKLLASGMRGTAATLFGNEGSKAWDALKLWDAATGGEIRSIQWPTDGVWSLTFSADGKHIASAGGARREGGQLKLWDVASGREVVNFEGHKFPVQSVAFSPDGKLLASSSVAVNESDKGEVRLWDATTGKQLLLFKVLTGMLPKVAFSPDGKRLAGALGDNTVKVWDSTTGLEILTLLGHTGPVQSVAFSPDGKRIATSGGDKTVRLWEAASGQEVLALERHTELVSSVAFSADGKRLASSSWDRTIIIWDASKSLPLDSQK